MTDPVQLPPQDLEAESAVLGSMLIERDAVEKAAGVLDEKDFYDQRHRLVFAALRALFEQGGAVDVVTAAAQLRKMGSFDAAGGADALTVLVAKVATAAHVEYYARIVKEKSILRELINVATKVVSSCYAQADSPQEILDQAQATILRVSERQPLHGVLETKDIAPETIERIEIAHKKKQRITGVASGIAAFDNMTAGFQKSDLILIAARPSQGKTALALNIAANVVLADEPKPVLFFSMEQSSQAIMERLIAMKAQVDLHLVRNGYFPSHRWSDLTNAAARFTEAPLYIVDTPGLNVLGIRTISRQLNSKLKREKKSLELIVIDYLQLIRGSTGRGESRQQEVSDISRSLKFLARDLNVPVIAVSQLSRGPEEKGRSDFRPRLSDLRESGALEQDADLVSFIYRESYYKRNDPTLENKAEIIIAKQRQGPVGIVNVSFILKYLLFGNAAPDSESGSEEIEPSQAAFPET